MKSTQLQKAKKKKTRYTHTKKKRPFTHSTSSSKRGALRSFSVSSLEVAVAVAALLPPPPPPPFQRCCGYPAPLPPPTLHPRGLFFASLHPMNCAARVALRFPSSSTMLSRHWGYVSSTCHALSLPLTPRLLSLPPSRFPPPPPLPRQSRRCFRRRCRPAPPWHRLPRRSPTLPLQWHGFSSSGSPWPSRAVFDLRGLHRPSAPVPLR